MNIFTVNKLNYLDINNLSLEFKRGEFSFIVGSNNSGKTSLFNIFSGKIIINNAIYLNGVCLNNRNDYFNNIGCVSRVNENSFFYKKVLDEMLYPLIKRGYTKGKGIAIIKDYLSLFNLEYLIDKNINDLNIYEKQKLLIVISLLNKPKVLLMDNPLDILEYNDACTILDILKKLCKDYLTIIYFTNNLNYVNYMDRIYLFNNKYQYIGEYHYNDIFDNDKVFYDNNIEIPFIIDLSIKLKMYNLIDKNYYDIKALVDDIWD